MRDLNQRLIKLDYSNGSLNVGSLQIRPMIDPYGIQGLRGLYKVEQRVINDDYKTYYIVDLDNGEITLSIYFFKDKVTMISVSAGKNYPSPFPFEISNEDREVAKKILWHMGGERDYTWGKVEYSEDHKSGNVGVVVSYNKQIS
jgi:hypothetical protein